MRASYSRIRAALAAGAPELAARLADALKPRHPLQHRAAVTAHALLAEHHGQHAEAAASFTAIREKAGKPETQSNP